MNQTHPINDGLLMIHKIISRGLKNAIKKCHDFENSDTVTPVAIQGFSQYLTALKNIVHSHHLGEDDVVFPFFRSKLEAPFDLLAEDHKQISKILEELDRIVPQLTSEKIGQVASLLEKMDILWEPHCRIEEQWFSVEKLESLAEKPDEEKLAEEVSKHGLKHAGPGYLALPFVLYTLDSEERKAVNSDLPWMVKRVLLPVVWKKRWKAMEPFLSYYRKN